MDAAMANQEVRRPKIVNAVSGAEPTRPHIRLGEVRPVPFSPSVDVKTIETALRKEAAKAKRAAKELAADIDLTLMDFADFGDASIKRLGVSPDAFVQLAMQLAYYRERGRFDLTYESCTSRLLISGAGLSGNP